MIEDRLAAIVLLLEDRMEREAHNAVIRLGSGRVMTAPATVAHETGVFDLDDEAYFTSPLARASLSSTGARELLKPGGPARFRHHMDAGTLEVRREFDVGHAVHTLVLGAGPQPIAVVGTGKGGPNAWQNQADKDLVVQARAAGRVPLRPADMAARRGDGGRGAGAPDRREAVHRRPAGTDADLARPGHRGAVPGESRLAAAATASWT
jgi:hypothetical protein